jgi:hypothetical protein
MSWIKNLLDYQSRLAEAFRHHENDAAKKRRVVGQRCRARSLQRLNLKRPPGALGGCAEERRADSI